MVGRLGRASRVYPTAGYHRSAGVLCSPEWKGKEEGVHHRTALAYTNGGGSL